MINDYVVNREVLACLFILVDSRHEPQKIDLEFIQWAGELGVPLAIVFTKVDKMGKTKLQQNLAKYKRVLSKTWEELPPTFETSSLSRIGQEDLLNYIESINKSISQ